MNRINRRYARRLAVALPVVAAVLLFLATSAPTQATPTAAPTDYFVCTLTHIGAFSNRVHVRCNPAAPNNISYFAACNASDSATASRYLSIFTTAKAMGKNLAIYYTPSDTSGTACGCSSTDCRVLWGAEVLP
jgi:hypothetical protein